MVRLALAIDLRHVANCTESSAIEICGIEIGVRVFRMILHASRYFWNFHLGNIVHQTASLRSASPLNRAFRLSPCPTMKCFRPKLERLEARQLLAGDFDFCIPVETGSTEYVSAPLTMASPQFSRTIGIGEPVSGESDTAIDTSNLTNETSIFSTQNPIIDYASSSILAETDAGIVVANRQLAQLSLIDYQATGTSLTRFKLDLGNLQLQEMSVDGNRAILVGQLSGDSVDGASRTQVIAVDLQTGVIVEKLDLPVGSFSLVHLEGDSVWLTLENSIRVEQSPNNAAGYRDQSTLLHLQWTSTGLKELSSLPVESGIWAVANDRVFSVAGPTHESSDRVLRYYGLASGELRQRSEIDLREGYAKSISVSSDGLHVSLVRGVLGENDQFTSNVDLIDVADTQLEWQGSIKIDGFVDVIFHDPETVMLQSQDTHSVLIFDFKANPNNQFHQSEFALPSGFQLRPGMVGLGDGRLLATAHVSNPGSGQYIVILDRASGRLQTIYLADATSRLLVSETNPGDVGFQQASGVNLAKFTYGHVGPNSTFVVDSVVEGLDGEVDELLMAQGRLIAAANDRLTVFDLDNSGVQIGTAPTNDDARSMEAVDIHLELVHSFLPPTTPTIAHLDSELLNHVATIGNPISRLDIVRLVGAPAGVQVDDRLAISFSTEVLEKGEALTFSYVLSNGFDESQATISVTFRDAVSLLPIDESLAPVNAQADSRDVNGDGVLSSLDALIIINFTNKFGAGSVAEFESSINSQLDAAMLYEQNWRLYDVSDDERITTLDALIIINELNAASNLRTAN